jgi:vacuolar protein sorting-associated protein 26
VQRHFGINITQEKDIIVHLSSIEPPLGRNVRYEIGVPGKLHIEIEYEKNTYHLRDCIIGKLHFMMLKVKFVKAEIRIMRRETCGTGLRYYLAQTNYL